MNNKEDQNNKGFSYTYSATQKKEVENIRKKYLPEEDDKLARLKKLDNGVQRKGTAVSLILGVIGSLILGVGMCCILLWTAFFVLGIGVGTVGIGVLSLAYPAYKWITERERKRIAPEIIRLSDELLK